MKKVILGAMVFLWMVPATLQAERGWGNNNNTEGKKEQQAEQKREDLQPVQSLEEKIPAEKQAVLLGPRGTQVVENKTFQQGIYDRQITELKVKLAKDAKLTEAQRNEILAAREDRYRKNEAFRSKRRSENIAFFQNFANDPGMTEQEKREAIRAHYQSQKSADQIFRQEQKDEIDAEREKLRSWGSSLKDIVAQ
jgi:membrane-associated HD superfamily phosphohydrolase